MFLDFFRNLFLNRARYRTDSRAVIVSCFFNPENSPYRLIAFQKFYDSIKHLNHRIIECTIGDAKPQLPKSPYIQQVHSDSLLWHKESLLNKVIGELPTQFEYVLWVDADVKFTNLNWMTDAVRVLQSNKIVQLFDSCIHLNQNETEPDFDVEYFRDLCASPNLKNKRMWRSFAWNYSWDKERAASRNYHEHGHVGFAWGARREVLNKIPLYDRAMIGGADHIMAHAAAGHIPHECITKSFTDDIENVEAWMRKFYTVVQGKIGYVPGDLYHYWHGDIDKREYLKRIQDFTVKSKEIVERDSNGLLIKKDDPYMKNYFKKREVSPTKINPVPSSYCQGFHKTMGYSISDFVYGMMFYDLISGHHNEVHHYHKQSDNLVQETFS